MFKCLNSAVSKSNIFDSFENIFNNFDSFWKDDSENLIKAFNNVYPGFPPTDAYIKKDKTLVLEMAVSGYTEDLVDLQIKEDKLIITLSKEDPSKKEEERKYLQKGIKHSKSKSSYVIPTSKYKINEVKADLKDGLLIIEIPAKEEAKPKKIEINKV